MKDFLLNDDFEIVIANGDLVFTDYKETKELLNQYVNILVSSNKGDIRSQPLLGLNLTRNINSKFLPSVFKRDLDFNMKESGLPKIKYKHSFNGDQLQIKINTNVK